jgi:hypothetical protein
MRRTEKSPGVTSTRKEQIPRIKTLIFYINLLTCAECWKPVVEDADDDLREIWLDDSDFCRCQEDELVVVC